MARGNTYVCATCGKIYDYCPKCAITKPNFDAERYCTAAHADIFVILSKNGCRLASAEETLTALAKYDTTNLKGDIAKHIDSLQPKKVEAEVKEVETRKSFRTHE